MYPDSIKGTNLNQWAIKCWRGSKVLHICSNAVVINKIPTRVLHDCTDICVALVVFPSKSCWWLSSQTCCHGEQSWRCSHAHEHEPENRVTSGCRWWWCTAWPPDPEPGSPGTRAAARRRAWPQVPLFCPQTTCGWIPAPADTYWASQTEFPFSHSHPGGALWWTLP